MSPDKSAPYYLKLSEEELNYLCHLLADQPSPDALADAIHGKLSLLEDA